MAPVQIAPQIGEAVLECLVLDGQQRAEKSFADQALQDPIYPVGRGRWGQLTDEMRPALRRRQHIAGLLSCGGHAGLGQHVFALLQRC